MKTLTALAAVLALGMLLVDHSPVGTQQTSIETATVQDATEATIVHLAALLPLSQPHSTPSVIIEIACKKNGKSCRSDSNCCSGWCGKGDPNQEFGTCIHNH